MLHLHGIFESDVKNKRIAIKKIPFNGIEVQ